jgi:CMP-N,N'-diacetyllegionaminic acid synthase
MINNKKVLAIIPARSGSKRLPNKNILKLQSKPLIAWTVDAAKKSQYIDRVVVTTNCEMIANISREFGAEVPFVRPESLSSDTATSNDVLIHAIKAIKESYDIVVLLQPTSPLRTAQHIDSALEEYHKQNASGVVSVTQCEHSPLWSNTLPFDKSLGDFIQKENIQNSQALDLYYRLNGAIYIYNKLELLKNNGIFYNSSTYAFVMDNKSSVDIDTEVDFQLANIFLKHE